MYRQAPIGDRYDSPTGGVEIVDDSPIGQAKEAAGGAGSALKKYWIFIVIGLVVLGIGYVAFDFFVGSIKTATFDVTDTENKPLPAAVKVIDSQGKEVDRINSGTSIKLRKGEYTVRVSASGYKPVQEVVTIEIDGEIPIKLERNWNLEISAELPDVFVQGEKKTLIVSILNNGTEQVQTGLVFEGAGFSEDNFSFTYQKPIVIEPSGQANVEVEVEVKQTAKAVKGAKLSGTIRIEGLNNSNAKVIKTFELQQFDAKSISISPTKLTITTSEGTLGTQSLNIDNRNAFDVKGLQFKITILTKEFTDEGTIENWFVISENNVDILAKEKKVVRIDFTPTVGESQIPDTSEKEKISGKLEISNTYFSKELPIDITVNKSKVEISLDGISNQTLKKDGTSYPSKPLKLSIRNNGKLQITDVLVTSTDDDACITNRAKFVPDWIKFQGFQYDAIEAGKTQDVVYFVEPKGGEEGEIATCHIRVAYYNPRTGQRESIVSKPFLITLN